MELLEVGEVAARLGGVRASCPTTRGRRRASRSRADCARPKALQSAGCRCSRTSADACAPEGREHESTALDPKRAPSRNRRSCAEDWESSVRPEPSDFAGDCERLWLSCGAPRTESCPS